jgi:hypothetical protein
MRCETRCIIALGSAADRANSSNSFKRYLCGIARTNVVPRAKGIQNFDGR